MPHAGSVIRWRTITLIRAPNTSTPRWRTLSVVSSAPSRREPETKSARSSRIGCTTPAELLGLVLPVGVDRGDDLRPARPRQPVAEPQRRALPPVDRDVADERAGRARLARRWRPWRRRRRRSPRSRGRPPRPGSRRSPRRRWAPRCRRGSRSPAARRRRAGGPPGTSRAASRSPGSSAAISASTAKGLAGSVTCSSGCCRARLISALRPRPARRRPRSPPTPPRGRSATTPPIRPRVPPRK